MDQQLTQISPAFATLYSGIQTRAVLAGAYRGRDIGARALLTHALKVGEAWPLCRSISEESLADEYSGDTHAPPTCARCLARDPRHGGTLPRRRTPKARKVAPLTCDHDGIGEPGCATCDPRIPRPNLPGRATHIAKDVRATWCGRLRSSGIRIATEAEGEGDCSSCRRARRARFGRSRLGAPRREPNATRREPNATRRGGIE